MMKRLDRRTVLRGLLGAAAVSIGLPPLEIFMTDNGDAYAGESGFPKRFGWWFFGNGVHAEKWVPEATGVGDEWELSPQLAPLADHKDAITVVSGLKVFMPNSVPHGTGPAGILTGRRLGVAGGDFGSSSFGAPSLDQIIANEVGGETLYRSLEVAVQRTTASLSYSAPNQPIPPENSPHALFKRLFASGFTEPGDTPIIDPTIGLRRSVLDVVSEDASALKKRLGHFDGVRVEQHFDNIRSLEKKLQKLEEDPPNLASCMLPAEPLEDYPDANGVPQMSAVSRVMSDLVAMALACDQTRVFSVMFSKPVNGVLYPGATAGHHQLTHDELGDQPQVHAIIVQIIEELAYFIGALRAIPEGDGNLLDNSAVLGFSDCSFGKSHAVDDYPLLLAGSACGALRQGIHYRAPSAENASKLGFSILRAMDLSPTAFGGDEGLVTEGIDEIET
jgi:hypothetical protein